jgi:Coenzyme PQQ synthesis protein D (PqqD)
MMSSPVFDTQLTPSPDALVRVVGEESVVLDLASGRYLGMNPVGTRVWELLTTGSTPAAAVSTMLDEFEVDEAVLRNDVSVFVGELLSLGLVSA